MKRKTLRDGALTNNSTPTESMPDVETAEEFTDRDAAKAQERAKKADKEAKQGSR